MRRFKLACFISFISIDKSVKRECFYFLNYSHEEQINHNKIKKIRHSITFIAPYQLISLSSIYKQME